MSYNKELITYQSIGKDEVGVEKRSVLTGVLICCILCGIALFVVSHRFIDTEVTPKRLGIMLCTGIIGFIWSVLNRKVLFPITPFHIILSSCLIFVFFKMWLFLETFSIYPIGLLLLLYLLHHTVAVCSLHYLLGTVVIFSLILSLQGIFQYAGIIPSSNSNFDITGSFDNPAGFAAALTCALPICFHFFKCENQYMRKLAMSIAGLMTIAIIFSGSRAGIFAVAIVTAFWLLQQSKTFSSKKSIVNQKTKILLVIMILVLSAILYFFKKDSADGRLLIWLCTIEMVAEKPIFGHGQGAFDAKYMLYQAEYMSTHPDNRFTMLADNVSHPFNEYLLVLSEYGFTGLSIIILLILLLIRSYKRDPDGEKLAAMMSLLALAIFSFFSYPFRYPFTWILLLLNLAVIFRSTYNRQLSLRVIIFLLSAGLFVYSMVLIVAEMDWKRIARLSMMGKTLEVLPEYDRLYQWFDKNGLFLYNHAAELYQAREYERSIDVFKQCTQYLNDMDVQMFLAANYRAMGSYVELEKHLKMASAMCPARFMPLYELVKLYETVERRDESLALAKKIIDKDVKIPSSKITAIKNEMRQLIEEGEQVNNN